MEKVADTYRLQKRGDIWHYYRRVPKKHIEMVGKSYIKKSLGVSSRLEAIKLRAIEDVITDALFASYAKGMPNFSPVTAIKQDISMPMITEYVRAYVAKTDHENEQKLLAEPIEDQDDLRERLINAGIELNILDNPVHPDRHRWINSLASKILNELGCLTPSTDLLLSAEDIAKRALYELRRRKNDRYVNNYEHSYYDVLFDPDISPSITFEDLSEIFWKERSQEYALNGIGQKRIDKVLSIIEVLKEIIGNKQPVSSIDDDTVQLVRTKIAQLPTNKNKIYPKLHLDEVISRAEKEGRKILSFLTQRVYLDIFRDILKVAVRKKFINNNPALDINPLIKETVAPSDKRFPWSGDQLKGFFHGKFYVSCAINTENPYVKPDRAWRFWLPLIMLFSGSRPNEVAQLNVDDLKRTKLGTWYLDHVSGDGKKLKNKSSHRRVPLHEELIRLGFIEFVNERKSHSSINGNRLFWELKPDKYGNFAKYPCQRLNEYFIPQEIKLDERQSLYSLRHNVRDALRRIQASDASLLAITGWSPKGTAVSDDYGDPGNPDLHLVHVNGIKYADLDLQFLYV